VVLICSPAVMNRKPLDICALFAFIMTFKSHCFMFNVLKSFYLKDQCCQIFSIESTQNLRRKRLNVAGWRDVATGTLNLLICVLIAECPIKQFNLHIFRHQNKYDIVTDCMLTSSPNSFWICRFVEKSLMYRRHWKDGASHYRSPCETTAWWSLHYLHWFSIATRSLKQWV